jgi:regulator of RNase E activity RraA
VRFSNREDIVQLTPLWKGDRFDDGRPRVSDDVLRRMRRAKTEDAWRVLWEAGFRYQFEGDWHSFHPERVMVGRAVTGVFVPTRPDLHDYLMQYGHEQEKRVGAMNSWVIQTLVKDDAIVIDLFGKIYQGTYAGGNLSTAINARTGTGMVIYGGIRDAQQIERIEDFAAFFKGVDPTGIADVTLVGLNVPCRIGAATCMPGDVVLGTRTGVIFIPPHLAEDVVAFAERTYLREYWGFMKLCEGVYTSSQMDTKWTPDIEEAFAAWYQQQGADEVQRLLEGAGS